MTASELARTLNGRRVGKGRWMALCPAHADRKPSLSITAGRKVPVIMICRSGGCDTASILEAAGLQWSDLFDGDATPALRQRMSLVERRELLEKQLELIIMLGVLEKGKKQYWAAAENRVQGELDQLRCWLEPEKVIQEYQSRAFQTKLRKVGWKNLWEEIDGIC